MRKCGGTSLARLLPVAPRGAALYGRSTGSRLVPVTGLFLVPPGVSNKSYSAQLIPRLLRSPFMAAAPVSEPTTALALPASADEQASTQANK
jgi:hypothetical protein